MNFDFYGRKRPRSKRNAAPVLVRLRAYLASIFAKGCRCYPVNFDRLAKAFSCSRRMVELCLSKIRAAGFFNIQTRREGRSFRVFISDRNPSIAGVFSLGREKNKPNTPRRPASFFEKSTRPETAPATEQAPGGWEKRKAPAKILALAAWIARNQLGKIHRAASRSLFRIEHAANFAASALHAGHDRADIVSSYEYAARSIDSELSHLPPAVRWEPSSLIKLARRRLADGLSDSARVSIRVRCLARPAMITAPVLDLSADHSPAPVSPFRRFNLGRALLQVCANFGADHPAAVQIRAELAALAP